MKNIPIYNEADLARAGKKDDDFEVEIFRDFISQLFQIEELKDKEKKLIENVYENGTEILNENEKDFLKKTITRFKKECRVCHIEIPLNEVFLLGNLCSYHENSKDE